jgi:hypothetical protein
MDAVEGKQSQGMGEAHEPHGARRLAARRSQKSLEERGGAKTGTPEVPGADADRGARRASANPAARTPSHARTARRTCDPGAE